MSKSVTFSETPKIYEYERASASEIYNMHWQDDDYRRFREQKLLDDLQAVRERTRKAGSPSRRASLDTMMNHGASASRELRGTAKAA